MRYSTILTIAGSDSCGGAGIQADIKTISALGGYACSAITAITAQNTQGVRSVQGCSPAVLGDQISAVMEDMRIDAVKSGMLFNKELVEVVAEQLKRHRPPHYVLDPVMVSTSGSRLIEEDAIAAVKSQLFPIATMVTPNIPEAEVLSGIGIKTPEDMVKAASAIMQTGCRSVLMKGGHLESQESVDLLFIKGESTPLVLPSKKIATKNTHGTGCTLSAAIATFLAHGEDLRSAVTQAHAYLHNAIELGKDIEQGKGHGPVMHSELRTKE